MNTVTIPPVPADVLNQLSEGPRACIERLLRHFNDSESTERPDLSSLSPSKLAAVLVLLYEQAGELRVLLTTRSQTLRTHPGRTALPGGKADDSDGDLVTTAYREAHEEVGLPLNSEHVHTLGIFRPHIFHKLLVTPVLAVLTRPDLLKDLKASEAEVDCIFNYPLEAIVDPSKARNEPLVEPGSTDWPYSDAEYHHAVDYKVPPLNNTTYRSHYYRTSASNIHGLTGDILIRTAEIAYDKSTVFERYAHDQVKDFESLFEYWRVANNVN